MYQPFNYIAFRTPTLPFSFQKDYAEIMKLAIFQDALFFASPSLYRNIYSHQSDDHEMYREKKTLYPLIRYINRITTRCTPFGLFAGYSFGELHCSSENTSLIIHQEIQKHIRLDMTFLCKLSEVLIHNSEIRNFVFFYTNPTLYKVGRKIRFIEKNAEHSFQISTVEYSAELNQILKLARQGVKRGEVVDFLITLGVTKANAMDYVDDLIDSQLLISEMAPAVTGQDYLSRIVEILNREGLVNEESHFVRKMGCELKHLNNGNDVHAYKRFLSLIESNGINYDESRLFQVDIARSVYKIEVSRQAIKDLNSIVTFLCKTATKSKSPDLQRLIEAFYEKYGDCEVPLLEVLDPEIGLGYPLYTDRNYLSPLLENFQLPLVGKGTNASAIDPFYCKLSQKIIKAIASKSNVFLKKEDLSYTEMSWDDMPSVIGLMCELVSVSDNDLLLYLKSVGGGCGANLLARFAYMDKKMENFLREVAQTEQLQNKDVIFAEISCLPDERMGNILHRPHIRDCEIVLLTSSELSGDQTIYSSDLLLSFQDGDFCLKSKRLGKRIFPRLTTAHNFSNSELPIYRFLCDMQTQEPNVNLPLNQSLLLSQFGFIPQIRYNNIILSLATWNVYIKEIKYLFQIQDAAMLLREVFFWRKELSLPRYCLLMDGDNTLFVDWENFDVVQSLFCIIKKRNSICLSEFIFDPDSAVVKDEKGNPYLNECIFIYKKEGL